MPTRAFSITVCGAGGGSDDGNDDEDGAGNGNLGSARGWSYIGLVRMGRETVWKSAGGPGSKGVGVDGLGWGGEVCKQNGE